MFASPVLIVIAILLLIFGLLLYFMGVKVLENDQVFFLLIGIFLALFLVVGLIMRHYMSLPSGGADISSLRTIFSNNSSL